MTTLAKAAGVHVLHLVTASCFLIRPNVSLLRTAYKLLGHFDVSTTIDMYVLNRGRTRYPQPAELI
jgi:hypothetical protein